MEHMGNAIVEIIALIAVFGLIGVMILQHRALMKAQAFFMVAKSPQAYNKVMQTRIEKKFEDDQKKVKTEQAQSRKRFIDLINAGAGSDKDIAEFQPKGI